MGENNTPTALKGCGVKMSENRNRPTHRRTDANLYPPERQLTKASEPSFDLEGGAKVKYDHTKRFPAHDFL